MTYEERYIDKCIEDMRGEIFAIRLKRVTLTSGANGEDEYEFVHPMKNDTGMGIYILYNYETQNVYVDVAYDFAEDVEECLSTHTFYGYGVMEYISKKLQSCGFDVELIGWDKEINKVLLLNSCGYGLDKECYTWNSCIRNIKRFTRYIKSGVGLI